MTTPLRHLLCTASFALALPFVASADEAADVAPSVEPGARQQPGGEVHELQPPQSGVQDEPVRAIVPETPGGWSASPGQVAKADWQAQNPWGWGDDYVFPLSRDLHASDLPLWGKVPIYLVAAPLDLIQLPLGALGGLWGNGTRDGSPAPQPAE